MMRLHSFDPIEDHNATILILGSMPGRASLAASQYYAHPQNVFWRIMGELLQFDAAAPYSVKLDALKSARIALWDVLQSCVRAGSLDSRIERDTQTANDFPMFLRCHAKVSQVFFNGAKAQSCFKQHVLTNLADHPLRYARLPSTSPAHAALSYAQKLAAWRDSLRL